MLLFNIIKGRRTIPTQHSPLPNNSSWMIPLGQLHPRPLPPTQDNSALQTTTHGEMSPRRLPRGQNLMTIKLTCKEDILALYTGFTRTLKTESVGTIYKMLQRNFNCKIYIRNIS
jgi:hypothetical protein